MSPTRPLAALVLLTACAAHHPAPVAVAPAVPAAPHLPAPVADLYVHHVATPVDPLVTTVLEGRPWEEVLSGAASALALTISTRGDVDLSAARWAAVRAGYPFPVLGLDVVHAPHEQRPTLTLPSSGDVGLVRARGPDDDIWVVLHGAGGPDLPAVPREARVGDHLALSGPSWRASLPSGEVRALGDGLVFDREGEWLLQAFDAEHVVATLPVYVGVATPEKPPFVGSLSGADPETAAFNAVAAVWAWYGRDPPTRDATMDSVARVRLRALAAGGTAESPTLLLRHAGFVEGASGADCRAQSLRDCLETMWWSPDQRAVFAAGYSSVGVATSNDGQGVRVVLLAAK